MNRRKFAASVISTIGITCMAPATLAKPFKKAPPFETGQRMKSIEGLHMTLSKHDLATKNKDDKQFILTFDVHNPSVKLTEKLYKLTDARGKRHIMYMKPINNRQLQAEFNWRTHA